jgi:ABC-type uncharacterized transport system substrate-binding protein
MKRRQFITVLGTAAAWPVAALPQQAGDVRQVGVFLDIPPDQLQNSPALAALREGLGKLGWREAQNVTLLVRTSAGAPKQLQTVAQELIAREPEVIVAHGSGPLGMLLRETSTIPIVFVQVTDPVGRGFVKNLAHPGGNATGFSNLDSTYGGKLVQILTEIAPEIRRVTLLGQPETSPIDRIMSALQPLASSLSVEVAAAPVHDVAAIESALTPLTGQAGCGLVVMPDSFTSANRDAIIALAARQHLPAIYPFRPFAESGGLVSYGNISLDQFRLAAAYVDKILKGTKPADLPVQQPTKFELVINLKTAKALGLTVPQALLARADEVIE